MEKVKNRRASYLSRSVIGGSKRVAENKRKKETESNVDFVVDRFGYFIWRRAKTTG